MTAISKTKSRPGWKLVQDSDCHWYVIPADKLEHWQAWRETPEPDLSLDDDDQIDYTAWETPSYAVEVGGRPSCVTFNPDGSFTIQH